MTIPGKGVSPYKDWRREQADYLFHFRDLHKRADLLQKRLDEAQAMIARMQLAAARDGRVMRVKPSLGGIARHGSKWLARIQIGEEKFQRTGFATDCEAQCWLDEMSEAVGFEQVQESIRSAKASMAAKLELLMRNQDKREVM